MLGPQFWAAGPSGGQFTTYLSPSASPFPTITTDVSNALDYLLRTAGGLGLLQIDGVTTSGSSLQLQFECGEG